MDGFLDALPQAVLLVTALCMDTLVASFAYGTGGICIPGRSVLVIDGICTGTLGLSLLVGNLLGPLLPPGLTRGLSVGLLLLLGLVKLFDGVLKAWINRRQQPRQVSFRLFDLQFILQIYGDSTAADQDRSRVLSPGEAASLAVALSLDGLAVGFGAGLTQVPLAEILLVSLLLHGLAIPLGCKLGQTVAHHSTLPLSWLGGVLLILLALLKL